MYSSKVRFSMSDMSTVSITGSGLSGLPSPSRSSLPSPSPGVPTGPPKYLLTS